MFHVEEGENWYDRADERYHNADDCGELRNCPAPHGGFVTLGDNNRQYDQANGLAEPVAAEWVIGVARVRVPYLGYVRLITTGQAEVSDVLGAVVVSPENEAFASTTTGIEIDIGEPRSVPVGPPVAGSAAA
jgi:signal peptidase